jgi:hypothetical protein
MKSLSLHPAVAQPLQGSSNGRAIVGVLSKVVIALAAAFLLGLALEHVPATAASWSLPTAPAIAAVFTA